MFQSDYILRIIGQVGIMLGRIISALREARPEDALELTDEAMGMVLDVDPDIAMSLTGDGLLAFMGAGGDPDPVQSLSLGEILLRRAQASIQLGDDNTATREAQRAQVVLESAVEFGSGDEIDRAKELLLELDRLDG